MLPLAALLAALAAAPAAPAEPCVLEDGPGRPMVVCFDPGNRLALSLAPGATATGGPARGALEAGFGLRLRRSRRSRHTEYVTWSSEHRAFEGRALLSREAPPSWRVTGYEGYFLRHLDEGYVLVPTRNPLRIPFPFDIAVAPTFAAWERRAATGIGDRLELIRCALLLDAARDPTGIARLAFGPELSYAVERPASGAGLVHELEPLTGGQLRLRLESGDGLWAAQAQLRAGWVLSPGAASGLVGRAEADLERVVLAFNDQPISLRLAFEGSEHRAGVVRRELAVTLGLVAALGL